MSDKIQDLCNNISVFSAQGDVAYDTGIVER